MKKSQFDRINADILGDRIIVQEEKAEEKTKSGIIIPAAAQEKETRGTVVFVGNGTKEQTMMVNVGDTAIYGSYGGVDIKLDGETYKIIRQTELFVCLAAE